MSWHLCQFCFRLFFWCCVLLYHICAPVNKISTYKVHRVVTLQWQSFWFSFIFQFEYKQYINYWLYSDMFLFYDWPFGMRVFCKETYYFPLQFLAQFSAALSSFFRTVSLIVEVAALVTMVDVDVIDCHAIWNVLNRWADSVSSLLQRPLHNGHVYSPGTCRHPGHGAASTRSISSCMR